MTSIFTSADIETDSSVRLTIDVRTPRKRNGSGSTRSSTLRRQERVSGSLPRAKATQRVSASDSERSASRPPATLTVRSGRATAIATRVTPDDVAGMERLSSPAAAVTGKAKSNTRVERPGLENAAVDG